MLTNRHMTAEEFAECRHELPEAGRWHELHEGQPILMQPPDDLHGTTVLNLTRALAPWFQQHSQKQHAVYACPQIGLKVSRNPDTVYFPAISVFDTGLPFAEADNILAETVPLLIIDVASANDRRSDMRRRTLGYLSLGVRSVWVPDPVKKEIQIVPKKGHTISLGPWQTLIDSQVLPGFSIRVSDVFAQPEWWSKPQANADPRSDFS
ncbi:MAG: Uma2 family endonuclease [Planctomycetaceae bacterium]|nr:Uma2 family endonuclease [Planctomycetaceae bacterium]